MYVPPILQCFTLVTHCPGALSVPHQVPQELPAMYYIAPTGGRPAAHTLLRVREGLLLQRDLRKGRLPEPQQHLQVRVNGALDPLREETRA